MSISLVGAMAGVSPPGVAAQNDQSSANTTSSNQNVVVAGGPAGPIGGAVQTETNQAVMPTPADTPAAKVDIGTERPATEGDLTYPISGPDKFAKSIAIRNQEAEPAEAEEKTEEPGVSQIAADRDGVERADPGENSAAREKTVEQQDHAKRADLAEARTEKRSDEALVLEEA